MPGCSPGREGVGKASFAQAAARRVLAEAAGPAFDLPGWTRPTDHPIAKLIEAGSHPDMRWLERLPKEKGEGLARNITVDQVRELGEFLGLTPALSDWRAVVIDSVDDLERDGANALAQDARGAAAQHPVLPRQPCAGAAAADDPLALPPARFPAARR